MANPSLWAALSIGRNTLGAFPPWESTAYWQHDYGYALVSTDGQSVIAGGYNVHGSTISRLVV
jgi:hypothetical protein